MRRQRLTCARRQLDEHRLEEPLALETSRCEPFDDALEQHSLVRDVLIDDRDAFVIDGHDERVAELAERNHRSNHARSLRSGCAVDGALGARKVADTRRRTRGACTVHRLGNVPAYEAATAASSSLSDGRGASSCSSGTQAATERVAQGAANHLVHVRLIAEAHFGLRGMHVHVHGRRRHRDEQVHFGAAFLDRRHAVGVDDGVRDGPVPDDPPVDEDVLRAARRTLFRQCGNIADNLYVATVSRRTSIRSDRSP